MNTLPETILQCARSLPEGGVLSPKEFLHQGSQAGKWTKAVRHRLPDRIAGNIQPVIEAALAKDYAAMLVDQLMVEDTLTFEKLLDVCADLEAIINKNRVSPR